MLVIVLGRAHVGGEKCDHFADPGAIIERGVKLVERRILELIRRVVLELRDCKESVLRAFSASQEEWLTWRLRGALQTQPPKRPKPTSRCCPRNLSLRNGFARMNRTLPGHLSFFNLR